MSCPVCTAPQIVRTHAAIVPIEEVTVGSTNMQLVERSWLACLACHARWYVDAPPTVRVEIRRPDSQTVRQSDSQTARRAEEKNSQQPAASRRPREGPQPAAGSPQEKAKKRRPPEERAAAYPSVATPPKAPVPSPPVMHDPSGLYVRLPVGRDVVSAAQGIVDLFDVASGVARDVQRVQRKMLRGKRRGR